MRLLKKGLKQLPKEGLERIRKHIERGKPVLLDGGICKKRGSGWHL